MHQTVDVHPNINKSAKSSYVGNNTLKLHAWTQIINRLHIILEGCCLKFCSRIACRLFEFSKNVANRENTELFINEICRFNAF